MNTTPTKYRIWLMTPTGEYVPKRGPGYDSLEEAEHSLAVLRNVMPAFAPEIRPVDA